MDKLEDYKFAALDAAIEHVLCARGLDLVATEWLKAIGEGLHEFRVRHSESEIRQMWQQSSASTHKPPGKILLRVFVHFHGDRVILLVSGYDKGKDPSGPHQAKEIKKARKALTAWKEQQKRLAAKRT